MSLGGSLLHAGALLIFPVLLAGVVNRVKSAWAGRKGVPLLQVLFDIIRLTRKRPVYSVVSTGLVGTAPYVLLGTALVSGLIVPILGPRAPLSFEFDFVFFAYAWGLGRIFLMLGALDTGSSFEGMGASREAVYAALIEPAFFLTAGTLAAATGKNRLADLLSFRPEDPAGLIVWIFCLAALFVLLQVEAARIPVDDPNTHLELTMIHEVMVLDHSGPDLAAIQFASALKMAICASLLSGLLNPFGPSSSPPLFAAAGAGLTLGIGLLVGTVESLSARLGLRALPQYILAAVLAAFIALLSSTWHAGGAG